MAFTERISAACGRKKAELVLKHANIVNVFTESIEDGDVAVEDDVIVGIGEYDGVREIDVHGCYVAPGLIDGHIHLESSMASPKEFARMVVPHGTAAVITDPHEIANVAGTAGIRYMLEATEGLALDVYFMMPSCVPSTGLDEAGAVLRAMTVDDISAVKQIEQTCFSDAWSEKLLSDLLESEWDEAWVLTDTDGTRIGYANFRFLAGEGELMRIAVLPEHRGCGESKKLMDRLEISAKEKEAPDLTLEVRAGNTPAINLYKSYGFQAEAVRKNYYQNPVEDALIMWRRSVPSIPT